jgi:hypothetical protein
MLLVFRRTGNRRYAVVAKRPEMPDVEMDPAPGYSELIPHDLMHLVVEAKLGLARGIFGQLAAGAGTFRLRVTSDESSRNVNRLRKKLKKRGDKVMRQGRDDCLESERAVHICWQAWLASSQSNDQSKTPRTGPDSMQAIARSKQNALLDQKTLNEIFVHFDELSVCWSGLKVGEWMTVRWPDLKIL